MTKIAIEQISSFAMNQVDMIIKKVVIDLCSDIISDTPVDTGRLKNNWYPSKNTPSKETTEETKHESTARMTNFVNGELKLGDTFYLTNNMPYAYRIEFEGYSKVKAPQGMVRRNVQKWERYFAKH